MTTTTKTDRAIALADRATATLNDWLTTGRKADARKADAAYDEIVEACPTTVEGIAAVVSYLAYRQQVLLEDGDEPEIHSAFRSDVDAFCFVQCLDDAMKRMLKRMRDAKPVPAAQPKPHLSSYFSDVLVRDAFRRAEGGDDDRAAAIGSGSPLLLGGAAARHHELETA